MSTVKVKLAAGEYSVEIGSGLLARAASALQALCPGRKAVIVTNLLIRGLYGARLQSDLKALGVEALVLEVPDGEQEKSLQRAGLLYDQLADFQAERSTPLLALGGGVIGDLAGFVAATYLRGVPLIQLPTSLLAMVDSSVGGKVAINHGRLKNNVGAFYQPRAVVADTSALKTLPAWEFENGLAECIKYGVIADAALFELIEGNIERIKALDASLVEEMITRCVAIKAGVVEKDERDLGLRNILNFGHTAGHAFESASEFAISHGRAVALGMVTACLIARRMGVLEEKDGARIKRLLSAAGLAVEPPAGLEPAALIAAMEHDKKKADQRIRFVLPRKIGEVFIQPEVEPEMIREALREQNG